MATILSLPVELQTYILSFLTFYDHIPASQVCRLWQTILMGPQFQKTRYYNEPVFDWNQIFGVHEYFRPDYHNCFRFGCQIDKQEGTIAEYFIDQSPQLGEFPEDYDRDSWDAVTNISQSPFLDEPFFSPFVDMEALGAELATTEPRAIQKRVYRFRSEQQRRQLMLQNFVKMKERFRVKILVSDVPFQRFGSGMEFYYSATEQATVKQVIEGIWQKLWPMVRESVADSRAPFEIDFDAEYSKTADILVTVRSDVYSKGDLNYLIFREPAIEGP